MPTTPLLVLFRYRELLDRYEVRVNIVGNVELLPLDVQESVREMEQLTKHNSKSVPPRSPSTPVLTLRL